MKDLSFGIEGLVKKGNPRKIVSTIKYIFARDLNIGPRELRRMSLSEVLELLDLWKREQKETEKQMKKGRRR